MENQPPPAVNNIPSESLFDDRSNNHINHSNSFQQEFNFSTRGPSLHPQHNYNLPPSPYSINEHYKIASPSTIKPIHPIHQHDTKSPRRSISISFCLPFFYLTPFFLFFPPVNFSINNMNTFTPPTPRNPPPPGVNPLRKAVPMTNVFFTNFIFFLFFHSYLYFSIILKVNPKKNIYISNYTTFQ